MNRLEPVFASACPHYYCGIFPRHEGRDVLLFVDNIFRLIGPEDSRSWTHAYRCGLSANSGSDVGN